MSLIEFKGNYISKLVDSGRHVRVMGGDFATMLSSHSTFSTNQSICIRSYAKPAFQKFIEMQTRSNLPVVKKPQ